MDSDSPARTRRQRTALSATVAMAALGAALSGLSRVPPADAELGRRICYYLWK